MVTSKLVQIRLNRVKVHFSSNENREENKQAKCLIKRWKYKELNSIQEFFSPETFQYLSPKKCRF